MAGIWQGVVKWQFFHRAVMVEATVVAVEELRGPPKPRQKIPLHVQFTLADATDHRAVTHMPMLQVVAAGDRIRLLVDPTNPQSISLPLWSEVWAGPLTYLVCGALIMVLGRVLRTKNMR